jgi:predicted nucleic acid-binding protein
LEVRIAVDTNRYRDFCEGNPDVVEWFRCAERILIPLVVLAELRAGFQCGTMGLRNERVLQQFLVRPRVGLLVPDAETTYHFARLFRQLRVQGTPIPLHDIWIGALVLQHSLLLCTRDEHFTHLPQVPLLA